MSPAGPGGSAAPAPDLPGAGAPRLGRDAPGRPRRLARQRRRRRLLALFVRLAHWRRRPLVIGVTGSVGKTTTTWFLAALLRRRWTTAVTALEGMTGAGTLRAALGLPEAEAARGWRGLAGPAARALSAAAGCGAFPEAIVLELRAHLARGAVLRRTIRAVAPRIGVVTAVEAVHYEHFRALGAIVAAKRFLVESLPADGAAVLNADDPRVKAMAAASGARRVLFFGRGEAARDARALAPRATLGGLELDLVLGGAAGPLAVPGLVSRGHLYPLLAAAAAALACGLSPAAIRAGLAALEPPPGRGVLRRAPGGALILDDCFNANECSVAAALDTLAEAAAGRRRVAVLGGLHELGDKTREIHEAIGRRAAGAADLVVAVGEGGEIIAAAARAAGLAAVVAVPDPAAALAELAGRLGPDDLVLVKASRAAGLEAVVAGLVSPAP